MSFPPAFRKKAPATVTREATATKVATVLAKASKVVKSRTQKDILRCLRLITKDTPPLSNEMQNFILSCKRKYARKKRKMGFRDYIGKKLNNNGLKSISSKTLKKALHHFQQIAKIGNNSNSEGMRHFIDHMLANNTPPSDFLAQLNSEPANRSRFTSDDMQRAYLKFMGEVKVFTQDCYLLASCDKHKSLDEKAIRGLLKIKAVASILKEEHPLCNSFGKYGNTLSLMCAQQDTQSHDRWINLHTRKYLIEHPQQDQGARGVQTFAYDYLKWLDKNTPVGLDLSNLKGVLESEFSTTLYPQVGQISEIINAISTAEFDELFTKVQRYGPESKAVIEHINKNFKDKLPLFKDTEMLRERTGEEYYLIAGAFRYFERLKMLTNDNKSFEKLKEAFFEKQLAPNCDKVQALIRQYIQPLVCVPNDLRRLMQILKTTSDLLETFMPNIDDDEKVDKDEFVDFIISAVDTYSKPSQVVELIGNIINTVEDVGARVGNALRQAAALGSALLQKLPHTL